MLQATREKYAALAAAVASLERRGWAQPREIEVAHNWYNHTYRLDMYPSHCFFRDALRPRPNGKPRLFAGVLYSYLNTPFRDISSKYEQALTPAGQHRCFGAMMSREQILGIVA